jgi:acetyltransferase-like isoleucine patch superfamily enzyme
MRWDHRPLYLRRARGALDGFYARRFLHPHFDAIGEGCTFGLPYFVQVMGPNISLGNHVHVGAVLDNPTRLTVWPIEPGLGRIHIGDYAVINPGARISAGVSIELGKNALLASNVYITDADWHGHYDRVYSRGGSGKVVIEDNVWLGEGVLVGKAVRIGKNSIVGAGSIVLRDVPDNCIAAGNPARVVRELDPNGVFVSRSHVLADPEKYRRDAEALERELTRHNTLRGFLRYVLSPRNTD